MTRMQIAWLRCCGCVLAWQMSIIRQYFIEILIGLFAASCTAHPNPLPDEDNAAIIGGHDAEPGKWPWMVSLHTPQETFDSPSPLLDAGVIDAGIFDSPSPLLDAGVIDAGITDDSNLGGELSGQDQVHIRMQHMCGGSLILPQWVLTAAHCVEDGGAFEIRHTTSKLSEAEAGIRVVQVVMYPEYDPETATGDLALLRLERPIIAEKYPTVATASLEQRLAPSGVQATTLGWGITDDFNETTPDALQELQLRIFPEAVCDKYAYATDDGARLNYDHEHMLCAGFLTEDKGTCNGDSGGPLFVLDDTGRALLVGITSWGEECGGSNNYLEGFARVSRYHDWVFQVIADELRYHPH